MSGDLLVDEQWLLITNCLAIHAPASAATFRPPEPGAVVTGASELVGPWFSVQGGAGRDNRAGVLFGYVPLSAAESLQALEVMTGEMRPWFDDVDVPADDAVRPFIPIADSGAGPLLVVDARRGPERGTVKQLDWEDPTTLDQPLWSDLGQLLDDVVEALAAGRSAGPLGGSPVVTDRYLGWAPEAPPRSWVSAPAVMTYSAPATYDPDAPWSWQQVTNRVAGRWGKSEGDIECLAIIGEELDRLVTLDLATLITATSDEPDGIGTVDLDVLLAACVHYAFTLLDTTPPAWARRTQSAFMTPTWTINNFPSAEIRRIDGTPEVFIEHGVRFVY
jgi:hypothetical protein